MALLFSVSLYIITALSFIITPTSSTDWDSVRLELITRQNAFNSNNFVEYVFSGRRVSCFCLPCAIQKKYITVKDDISIDVTFSDNEHNCDERSLFDPDYRTINDWFGVSINYVDDYNECNGVATKTTAGLSCHEKSLSVTYDDTYNYPTSIIFDEAAMARDGGSRWDFECLDAYSDGIKNTANCDYTAIFPSISTLRPTNGPTLDPTHRPTDNRYERPTECYKGYECYDDVGHQQGPEYACKIYKNYTEEDCCDACSDNDDCVSWTWEYKHYSCFLFTTKLNSSCKKCRICSSGNKV